MIYDVVIIGAGPAGYTASIYASRYKLKNLIIGKEQGGQINEAHLVENYPGFISISGTELMSKFKEQSEKLGAKIILKQVKGIVKEKNNFAVIAGNDEKYFAKTIILAMGMGYRKFRDINITKNITISTLQFSKDDNVLIGVPVYSGRIPLVALQRLKKMSGENTNAILLVVYGNRHYDDALLELKNMVVDLGFSPIAAAAFIGHHSFSSDKYPIAVGRPNIDDLKIANNFGTQIMINFENYQEIKVPGTYPYRELSEKLQVKPKIDLDLCDLCGMCQKVCPVDAISIFRDRIDIDENLCIYCHACVKICPQKALTIDDDRIIKSAKNLYENCKQPQIPEIFL